MLLDVVDRRHQLIRLGRQGCVQAGEQVLVGDQAQAPALGRDGDGSGERSGDLGGRHDDGFVGMNTAEGLVKVNTTGREQSGQTSVGYLCGEVRPVISGRQVGEQAGGDG